MNVWGDVNFIYFIFFHDLRHVWFPFAGCSTPVLPAASGLTQQVAKLLTLKTVSNCLQMLARWRRIFIFFLKSVPQLISNGFLLHQTEPESRNDKSGKQHSTCSKLRIGEFVNDKRWLISLHFAAALVCLFFTIVD